MCYCKVNCKLALYKQQLIKRYRIKMLTDIKMVKSGANLLQFKKRETLSPLYKYNFCPPKNVMINT